MAKSGQQRFLAGFDDESAAAKSAGGAGASPTEGGGASSRATPPIQVLVPVDPPATGATPGILAGKTVYVIDSHSLIYQVFHAMPEMTSPAGLPVGAVHGFLGDIANLLEQRRPDYLFCAFDHPGENFRHDLFVEYKEHRESMPDDLRTQIPLIQQLLEALGLPVLSCPAFEADDVLATIARQVTEQGGECVLVTTDKDCRQLLSDRVRMLNVRKNEFFDPPALLATWGIRPDQVVDFQTLVGDSVDNIPGVPLIGPKIAQELLQKYETLEGIYEHVGELKAGKRRDNLVAGREQTIVSRQLVRLREDAPIELDWPGARLAHARPVLRCPMSRRRFLTARTR